MEKGVYIVRQFIGGSFKIICISDNILYVSPSLKSGQQGSLCIARSI